MKLSKYKNRRVKSEDGTFDSLKEFRRWGELKLLQRAGHITDLQRQVKYIFIHNGIGLGFYKADFVYNENGKQVVEDVKSEMTKKLPMYRYKKRMMAAFFGIDIKET